jgi:glyoxylase-like metal-dependent hydrolase (beta-lactamase superfamily II)
MAEIRVLVEGYANRISGGWIASSTVTLVKSRGKMVIVDPGCNRNKLLNALAKEDLRTGDVDYVFLTHNHTDHTLLSGIFERARVLDPKDIYEDDKLVAHHDAIPETGLKMIQTPGHAAEHCSLVVLAKGRTYIVAGDLFWWEHGEEQRVDIAREDPAHPANMKELVRSRAKVLEIAEYIIPGHGKVLRVNA